MYMPSIIIHKDLLGLISSVNRIEVHWQVHYPRHRVGFLPLFVCLFFLHNISKTDKARITKLNKETFHYESWKPI